MASSDWLFENIHLNREIIDEIAQSAGISMETHTFSILCQNGNKPALLLYKFKKSISAYYIINLRTLEPTYESECKVQLTKEIIEKMKSVNLYSI